MATPRMRRINEVLREVIGAAIATELSDPRIGFVTVTSVETSPDLRTAKVHVSVLGDEEEREATLEGLRSSHGVIQSKIAAETRMKRTPTLYLPLRPDGRAGHADLPAARGGRRSERDDRHRRLGDRAGRGRDPRPRPLPAHRPRGPRRRRPRLAARHAPPADPARQGLGDVPGGEGVPAADRVPLPAAGGGLPRAAGRHGRPHRRLPRLRQHRPHAGRLPRRRRTTSSSTSTTTTTTPCSATSTWSTSKPPARRRSSTSWRSCWAARSPPRWPRRSTSAWSPTPASSCTRTPTRAPTGSRPT